MPGTPSSAGEPTRHRGTLGGPPASLPTRRAVRSVSRQRTSAATDALAISSRAPKSIGLDISPKTAPKGEEDGRVASLRSFVVSWSGKVSAKARKAKAGGPSA